MIANAAFLAALTVFLLRRLAGRGARRSWRRFKDLLFRAARLAIGVVALARVLQPRSRVYYGVRAVAVPARHRAQAAAPRPPARHAGRGARRPAGAARSRSEDDLWTATSTLATTTRERPALRPRRARRVEHSVTLADVDPREVVDAGPRPAARAGRANASGVHGRTYHLRGSEVRTLATVGAFRVVPAEDLREATGRAPTRARAIS